MSDTVKQDRKAIKIKPETMKKINTIAENQMWSKTTTIDVAVSKLYNEIIEKQGK